MNPILIFDIETIPDLDTGRLLYPKIAKLSDDDAQTALNAIRQAEAGHTFMRLPLHKIACLSFLWVSDDKFSLKSLSIHQMSESEILTTFLGHLPKDLLLRLCHGMGQDLTCLSCSIVPCTTSYLLLHCLIANRPIICINMVMLTLI